jgi:3-deoxy-D-manno-octulosonic-acid transferase
MSLLTCTTAAGRETLKELHGESVQVAWLPYDYPGRCAASSSISGRDSRCLSRPSSGPTWWRPCRTFGVPVLLANARMSEGSALAYGRLPGLARPTLAALAVVCAQSEADAARLRSLGARRVEVTGNLNSTGRPTRRRAPKASPGTRASRARCCCSPARAKARKKFCWMPCRPGTGKLLVLVVPRHPRRFDEVSALAVKDGFPVARRSRGEIPGAQDRVHLGDTMGEMDFYYARPTSP